MARQTRLAASDDDCAWLDGPTPDDPLIVDKHGLTALIGEPVKAIEGFIKAGMPIYGERSRGTALRFRVPDCVQWLLTRNATPIEDAKRRAANAVARKREAEAARLEGESVAVAEAEAVIRDGYAKAQSRLLLIPPRFPTVREALESELVAAINDLSTLKVDHE